MSFLINGLSFQQYNAYLNPSSEPKRVWKSNHWVAHFNLARYSILIVLINRLAYLITHRFTVVPNNNYFFQKFKTYRFSKISNKEQYEIVKNLFDRFKLCPELNQDELTRIDHELKNIEAKLNPKTDLIIIPVVSRTPLREEVLREEPHQKQIIELKTDLTLEKDSSLVKENELPTKMDQEESQEVEESPPAEISDETKKWEAEKLEEVPQHEIVEKKEEMTETESKTDDQQLDLDKGEEQAAEPEEERILDQKKEDVLIDLNLGSLAPQEEPLNLSPPLSLNNSASSIHDEEKEVEYKPDDEKDSFQSQQDLHDSEKDEVLVSSLLKEEQKVEQIESVKLDKVSEFPDYRAEVESCYQSVLEKLQVEIKARKEKLQKIQDEQLKALSFKNDVLSDEEEENEQTIDLNNSNLQNSNLTTSSTLERLKFLFAELTSSQLEKEKVVEEIEVPVLIPLSKDVEAIMTVGFPLEDSQSLMDLFADQKIVQQYRRNLNALLHFEKKLSREKTKAADPRFEDYLKKANAAFQRTWEFARSHQCPELHDEFKQLFPANPAQLKDNGEVICTAQQLDWLMQTLTQHFPDLYHLSFDVPALGIYQSQQIISLAQLLLCGEESKNVALSSSCFIQLRESMGKATPVHKSPVKNNRFLENGSYIYTSLIGSSDTQDKEKMKEQISGLTKQYVKDWLERQGAFLQIGEQKIKGGQANDAIKASDWVACVRDTYTKTLLALSKEELRKEISKLFNCQLVHLIADTYADEIEQQEWTTSRFPAAILTKMFEEELFRTKDKPAIHAAIRQTIEDASFSYSDIDQLAQTADCSTDYIEPLIRLRVLYMMICLGQATIAPMMKGITKRAETMYDPAVCKNEGEYALSCQSSEERVLAFDNTLDQLKITVKTLFRDPTNAKDVAQGISSFEINSISCPAKDKIETAVVDLQDLRFNLYASEAQRRYLVAQVAPETLMTNMNKLVSSVQALELTNKFKRYQAAKDQRNVFSRLLPFDTQPYLDVEHDVLKMDQVLGQAEVFVNYLNTKYMLLKDRQLTLQQSRAFDQAAFDIKGHFRHVLEMLEEIYNSTPQEEAQRITDKMDRLSELLDLKEDQIGVVNAHSDSSEDSISSSEDEEIKPFDSDSDEDVIGAKAKEKGIFGKLLDNTVGYLTQETSEGKYLKWKIERYEELIKGAQKSVLSYIQTAKLGDIDQLIAQAKTNNAAEWIKHSLPILEFCKKSLREDDQRLNAAYLKEVRHCHQKNLLTQLRQVATWAKNHPQDSGAQHIDAICYQLYATVDINDCCQDVLKTFQGLGEAASKGKASSHDLPNDSRYNLIRDLHKTHQQIKAVPNDAKAPLLKQWANSAIGHLNGLYGIKDFDPNMQSNPMHVFFEKVITYTGENATKDSKFVKNIAMGSPTIEVGNGKVEINPEFLAFLRHCKRHGLRHLYINNQNFIPKAWIKGDESARCQALHDLANHEFKDTLFVMTLSQNSSFYEQKGHHLSSLKVSKTKDEILSQLLGKSKEMSSYLPTHLKTDPDLHWWMADEIDRIHQQEFANCVEFRNATVRENFVKCFHKGLRKHVEDRLIKSPSPDGTGLGYSIYSSSVTQFKEEMIAQLFDRSPHETGNYIPTDLVNRLKLRQWSTEAAHAIHQILFEGRESLTIEERRVFIRLLYQNLSRKVLIETGVDSYNASCKDRIDRGAATDAEEYAYLAILADCMNQLRVIAFFMVIVFVRAIIVRKRSIIEERLERLIETVKFMLENQKNIQELHSQLFPGIKITVDHFEAQPVPLKQTLVEVY